MQTETQQKSHEENRTARAEAIADVIVAYSKKYGQPVEEILAGADYHDWHCFLQTSYALLSIKGKKRPQPSDETKQLVRIFVKRDARVEDHSKKNIHTQDSDCSIDTDTNCCRVCGVDHSATCIKCHGHGFRLPTCPEMTTESEVH